MMARRSLDMVSGMVMMTLYPRAAPTMARPTPVFPEVASTMVPPGLRSPEASAARTMDRAMRSLTEAAGSKASTLARTVAGAPSVTRLMRTRGVLPTRAVASGAYVIVMSFECGLGEP